MSGLWASTWNAATRAIGVGAIVVIVVSGLTAFLLAGMLYANKEFSLVIIIAAVLSLLPTIVQICCWYRAQPRPRCWRVTIKKAWQEPIVGVAMHYAAILIGVSLGGLTLSENCPGNDIDWMRAILVIAQQLMLTGATWVMFGERLRKRIPPENLTT